MMKIQYGIAGFVIGIMTGLLIGLLEIKLFKGWRIDNAVPFIAGITVLACAVAGVVTGVRMARRL